MKAVIRKHVAEFGVKNPEYVINGLVADRKGIESEKGIAAAFNQAFKQGCRIVILDLDMHMSNRSLQTPKIAKKLCNRLDFNKNGISDCYVVYRGKGAHINHEDKSIDKKMEALLEMIKS